MSLLVTNLGASVTTRQSKGYNVGSDVQNVDNEVIDHTPHVIFY